MKIIAVLAMTQERLIGKNGELPWHIPEDLKHFQELTHGKIVVMGKNTYYSLPEKYRPLPHRRNIVLTRSEFSECESYASIDALLEKLKTEKIQEIYIIWGVQIYQAFFEAWLIDAVACTLIEWEYSWDAYLPEWRDSFLLESEETFEHGKFQRHTLIHPKIRAQLSFLKEKGFVLSDITKTVWYLEKVWLHRLRRYFNTVHSYKWVDFQRIIDAYVFDKKIRSLCLEILEPIEVSFKNQIILSWIDITNITYYKEEKQEERMIFIQEKLSYYKTHDTEIKKWVIKRDNINNILIDKLNFWEIYKVFCGLKEEYQYQVVDYYWIDTRLFFNWFLCFVYLRNLCSHWENVFNRKMTFAIKAREISKLFHIDTNHYFISYFTLLSLMRMKLISNHQWEEKIFSSLKKYWMTICDFGIQKETSHSQLESEAWEVLVESLYVKLMQNAR